MRRMNTTCAWHALANGIPWTVTKYNRSKKVREEVTVQPGVDCIRIVRQLTRDLPGGLDSPPDIAASSPTPTTAMAADVPHRGAAMWDAVLFSASARQAPDAAGSGSDRPNWKDVVSVGRFRPDEKELRKAYQSYFGCARRRDSSTLCGDERCPRCWRNPAKLEIQSVSCSRFNHSASKKASSGTGRWKGGDARAAGSFAPSSQDEWVFGAWSGENVEVHKGKAPYRDRPPVSTLTMVKIVCFFSHRGNAGAGGDGAERGSRRPTTEFVLGFEYVSAGIGQSRLSDVTTEHPIVLLRGRSRPLVWPVSAIRRHVHLYHLCPARLHPVNEAGKNVDDSGTELRPSEELSERPCADWMCRIASSPTGGGQVWKHKYRLANPSEPSYDKYILNEHHHSIFQDTFI